jgi:predicted DNA-binding transcriptional regulator AlpA
MPSALDFLPPELGRYRVLATKDAAEFVGLSYPEWRAMHTRGLTPPAVQIGKRKQAWRLGDLIDWLKARAETEQAMAERRTEAESKRSRAARQAELTT